MSEVLISRRDFTKLSLAYLAGAYLPESALPRAAGHAVPEDDLPNLPLHWTAAVRDFSVGPDPVTVIQLEPKPGKMPAAVEVVVCCPQAADNVLRWQLVEQRKRCGRVAAKLTGILPEGETPAVYAWSSDQKDGTPPAKEGILIHGWDVNQRATFRYVAIPSAEHLVYTPLFLGLVCQLSGPALTEFPNPIRVDVTVLGKNRVGVEQ